MSQTSRKEEGMPYRIDRQVVLGLILLIAIAFRFYDLRSIPPGFFVDEAMEGNQALEALSTGHLRVFYSENEGREGMFVWLATVPLRLFGNQPWALRSVSATVGVLTVLGLFCLGTLAFSDKVGAVAGFLLATSFWHTNFSRIGMRAILAPLFVVWMLYFFFRGVRYQRLWNFAVAGLLLGLGFYTYLSFRVAPAILLTAVIACRRRTELNGLKPLVVMVLIAVIAVVPLAAHFVGHPEDLTRRASEVVIWSGYDLVTNVMKTVGMFNYAGDRNIRHNLRRVEGNPGEERIEGEPMLPFAVGALLLVGIGSIHLRNWSSADMATLGWLGFGLLCVVLSDAAPHAGRGLIVVPAVYIAAANGLALISDSLKSRFRREWLVAAEIGLLAVTMAIEGNKYFVRWSRQPNLAGNFFELDVRIGTILNRVPMGRSIYVYVTPHRLANVDGIPVNAQTLMFITDTYTREKQHQKNIRYSMAPPVDVSPDTLVVKLP